MQVEQLRRYLDDPAEAKNWLRQIGVERLDRAHRNVTAIAAAGMTLDLAACVFAQLADILPEAADADMVLNNLDRFVAASRNPLALGSLFERDPQALTTLVQIFDTSQYLSDLLISDPESFDLLRMTDGRPVARDVLVDELTAETAVLPDEQVVMTALRRYKRRETLRICYGDIIREQPLATVAKQISYLAEAIVESAVRFARTALESKRGVPRGPQGTSARFVVLGMGKLGGCELNYSSDIDLIFLYDVDGSTDGDRKLTNVEFFDRLARDVVKVLTESTDLGTAYRVDLRLRPEGQVGPTVVGLEAATRYYDTFGRNWERQAYLKARPVAGDVDLGREFLAILEPWIYRRYLGLADINEIKALKRRIETRAKSEGGDRRDVKTGLGGIRDVEFAIQFLQLLNAGDQPQLRTGNTLEGIERLAAAGCLTDQERSILAANYTFLRKIEHRLQIMFDLQTHMLPDEPAELRKLAFRMNYRDGEDEAALDRFTADLQSRTRENRQILDHLLHDAFPNDAATEPEVDLVLDPDPSPQRIQEVLGEYPFRDVPQAYKNLMALANERIRFLSKARCRHFLASIAPRLIEAIAATADPDQTLVNLEKVSDSLGGKGVLWELFSFNPPTLRLYVELCASSPYLSSILTSNPGMIDELMDSLVLNRLPSIDALRSTVADLTRAAENLDPILHSFKNAQQLRVGVRDILGKQDVRATTGALSDIAQVCVEQIARVQYEKLAAKLGYPAGERDGEDCLGVIVAMGKFGGRELNYHSDLDVVFLYESEGSTSHRRRAKGGQTTSNQHFFGELGQRIIKATSRLGPYGRLYQIDARLRPTGRSGALATSFAEFARYFSEGDGQLWERQALCRARVVHGTPAASARAAELVAAAAFGRPLRQADVDEIRRVRARLEETSPGRNLKRGRGGIVDIEFLVQYLQLKYGHEDASLRLPNTLDALDALHAAGRLSDEDHQFLRESYQFLRTCEARLRLMSSTARDDLPAEPAELAKLAQLLEYADTVSLLGDFERFTDGNRRLLDHVFAAKIR